MWKKISNIVGTPMCISLSLFLITFLNFSFSFVTNFYHLLLIRFFTGLLNNLSTFMQSYLLEIFPSNKHKTVIQLFTFFQNMAVALAMLSGLLMSISLDYHRIDQSESKINKYFLIAFLVAVINFCAFILNLIKYRFKILIPKRRTQFYEQCDLNLDLSQRKENIIKRQKSSDSTDSSGRKRYSNSGYKEYSIHVMDKSNLHNPNKTAAVEKYNSFGTLNSNKTGSDDRGFNKMIELQTKKPGEIINVDEKESNSQKDISAEMNIDHSPEKLQEISGVINNFYETADNNLSSLSQGKKHSEPALSSPNLNGNNNDGFFQFNDEPHEVSNNRDNADLTKNTIGIKHSHRLTQTTDKSLINLKNEDFAKNVNLKFEKINKEFPIQKKGSSEKHNDIIVSSGSEVIRAQNTTNDINNKMKIGWFNLFKISSIFTILQVSDIILYNVFFLNLAFTLNPKNSSDNIFLISTAMGLYHLIYTLLLPVVNTQILKMGMRSNKKAVLFFKIFILISIGLYSTFLVLDYLLSEKGLTYVIVLMSVLVIRNLSLTVVLICYNVLVLKISQSQVKEKINNLQNYFSLLIRTIFGTISFVIYLYFADNYQIIAITLGVVPIGLLVSNLRLVKNLTDIVD
jgi:hypothetical protein